MKKYAVIFSIAWQRALAYRGVSVIFTLFFLINGLLSFAIWVVAFKSSPDRLAGTLPQLLVYFTILIFIHQLIQPYTAGVIANEHIKQGQLSMYLLKPIPYFRFMFLTVLPWRIVQFLLSLPLAIVLMFAFRQHIALDYQAFILGFLLLPLALLLSFIIQLFFAQFAFWFDDATGFLNVAEVLTLLFSGAGIPIFLFPEILKQIGSLLPFQYAMYFPVATLSGLVSITEYWRSFFMLLTWIVGLGLIVNLLWRRGLRRFTGEGI
mgnify:CR=1 FL=1